MLSPFTLLRRLIPPALAGLITPLLAQPPAIRVTGVPLQINEQADIPTGLFGVHAVEVTNELAADWGIESVRIIHANPDGQPTRLRPPAKSGRAEAVPGTLSSAVDCWFDRYVPALQLSDPDWQSRLETLARTYAGEAAASGEQHYLEFWNEPYLNWATKPGVNYAPTLFRTDGVRPGDPMVLKTTGLPVPGLVWDREIFYVQKPGGAGLDFVLSSYLPRSAEEGDTVTLGYGAGRATLTAGGTVRLRGKDHTLVRGWSGHDPEQKFYWSGPVNERLYNEMLGVVGRALKTANPHVKLAGGWGFNFYNENWAAWETLIRPTIDKNHPWIDALNEHHYGGDTRMVAASYEVAYAYALTRYGKRLGFWNTEAGGYLDPQQPGNPLPYAKGDAATRARSAFTYMMRDIAYLLDRAPDKGLRRAAHQPRPGEGEDVAFKLLKPLRGRLLAVESNIPRVWSCAALQERALTVLLFNDSNQALEIPLSVAAPSPARFAGMKLLRVVANEDPAAPLRIESEAPNASGAVWEKNIPLGPKQAALCVFSLSSAPRPTSTLVRTQYCAPTVLTPLKVKGLATPIEIAVPAGEIARADGAVLRLVTNDIEASTITINDETIATSAPPDTPIWDLAVPVRLLRPKNIVLIESASAKPMLLAASLYLEKTETR